jgi:putative PIN family toxin of toxin-antitoxin system
MVLDTDVVIAGLRSPTGASAELLRMARRGELTLLISVPLFIEYDAKCLEKEHLEAAGLTTQDVQLFLDALTVIAKPVSIHFTWRPQLTDPADEMVLETAINGQAKALVTFNQRDFGKAQAAFGIELLLPSEALRRLR